MRHLSLTSFERRSLTVFHQTVAIVLSVLMIGLADGYHRANAELPSGGSDTRAGTSYDGETVFRGLFFGSGPVARLFPEIWEHPDVKASVEKAKSQQGGFDALKHWEELIVDRLKSQDGSFFDRFGTEMQSGDHLRIQLALDQAVRTVLDTVNSELGGKSEIGNRKPSLPLEMAVYRHQVIAVDIATVAQAALAAQVAVAVAAVVVLFLFYAPSPNNGTGAASLQREMWIDMIAQRLAS